MSQGVTIRKLANQVVPKDYLELAVNNGAKVWGGAFVDKGILEIPKGTDVTVEMLEQTFEEFKDIDVTLILNDSTAGTNLEAMPPYPLIETDDEQPLVAIIPEGNFPSFEKKGSANPPMYFLAEHLFDEFNSAFDMCDKNLDKFMENITKDSFKKKMNLNSVGRGYITVIAQNGKCVTFGQGDTDSGDKFPWGWVSNTFGYGKEASAPAEPEKKKSMFSRSTVREKHHVPSHAAVASGATEPPKTETAIPKTTNTGSNNPQPPKTETKRVILAIDNIEVVKVKIPPGSRRERRGWIKQRLGYVPPTVDNMDQVYSLYKSPTGAILTRDEINKHLGLSAAKLRSDKPLLGNPKPTGSDTDPDHIDPDKQVSGDPLPVLSPNARKSFQAYLSNDRIKKIIAEGAEQITDPKHVQGLEGKIPPFGNQLGLADMKDFDALPFAEFENLCRQNFHGFATMCWSYRNRALKAEMALGKAEGKTAEPVSEAPVEKKRSMFSRNKAA